MIQVNIFLDYHSRTPIYEQIKEQIVLDISRGVLKKDDQLPSLRQLSSQLGININTVKRALSELEAQGVIYSVAGKGIFISGNAESQNIYLEQSLDAVKNALISAKQMGASEEKITAILKEIYKGVE
ncbi:MAG: GntR family transcriptional regulator [Ruminococcaceae bacterium]|nr:GntR family transcriptional regulator [Oscillospiraceae bacterium]